jgi:hypothetical protein
MAGCLCFFAYTYDWPISPSCAAVCAGHRPGYFLPTFVTAAVSALGLVIANYFARGG